MGMVHFVGHHGAPPLCGTSEAAGWVETLRAEAVTCERCLSRLAGTREGDAAPKQGDAAGKAAAW